VLDSVQYFFLFLVIVSSNGKNLFKNSLHKKSRSCYLRHMSDVLKEADIDVTKEKRKDIDRALHSLVGVEYKGCSSIWKELKKMLQSNERRHVIVQTLKEL
jgi:hypothetical protein